MVYPGGDVFLTSLSTCIPTPTPTVLLVWSEYASAYYELRVTVILAFSKDLQKINGSSSKYKYENYQLKNQL